MGRLAGVRVAILVEREYEEFRGKRGYPVRPHVHVGAVSSLEEVAARRRTAEPPVIPAVLVSKN